MDKFRNLLKVEISGDSEQDLLEALDEVKKMVDEGYLSGFGSNQTGGFEFDLIPEVCREGYIREERVSPEWLEGDQEEAYREGWVLSLCEGSRFIWQLQSVDDSETWEEKYAKKYPFTTDGDVWSHVVSGGKGGNPLHKKALCFLMSESPQEYSLILESLRESEYRVR